jgi:hypothetical protein
MLPSAGEGGHGPIEALSSGRGKPLGVAAEWAGTVSLASPARTTGPDLQRSTSRRPNDERPRKAALRAAGRRLPLESNL